MKNSVTQSARTVVFIAMIIVLMTFAVQQVAAGTSHTVQKSGFLSSITAKGRVRSFPGQQQGLGVCDIRSYTEPKTTINIIGWTWWQCG
jgi:hypothetical protein